MSAAAPLPRFTAAHPCPICSGAASGPSATRCTGYYTGQSVYCSNTPSSHPDRGDNCLSLRGDRETQIGRVDAHERLANMHDLTGVD